MNQTSTFSQKAFLVAVGIILSFMIIEGGLRLAGYAIVKVQDMRNQGKLKAAGVYRIMCIGESTTCGQYPRLLEAAMNANGKGMRFIVVDKGRGGTNTSVLESEFPGNVAAYRPDMVVAMMGINDAGYNMVCEKSTFLAGLKIYKIYRLLKIHLSGGDGEVTIVRERRMLGRSRKVCSSHPGGGDPHIISACNDIQMSGDPVAGEMALRRLIERYPDSVIPSIELAKLYFRQGRYRQSDETIGRLRLDHLKSCDDCVRLADYYLNCAIYKADDCQNNAIRERRLMDLARTKPEFTRDYHYYLFVGIAQQHQHKYAEAERSFRKALGISGEDVDIYGKLAEVCWLQGKWDETESIIRKAIKLDPEDSNLNGMMGAFYLDRGNEGLAEEFFRKVDGSKTDFCKMLTRANYYRIADYATARGIKMVCMQYPMRKIRQLQSMMGARTDPENIIFVDNEKIFKEAVMRDGYDTYFRDRFAGDFGHCTDRGNRLLAENLADVILQNYFKIRRTPRTGQDAPILSQAVARQPLEDLCP